MKIKTTKYKAGSILLWREYNTIKKFWYWLRRKRLPYNRFTLMHESGDYLKLAESKVDEYILEPKKIYSKDETKRLDALSRGVETLRDLVITINTIRPNTVDEKECTKVDDLLGNLTKYYKVRHLLDEKEYSDYILPVE